MTDTGKIYFENELIAKPIDIIAFGSISSPNFADQRLVPALIISTSERPDIEEYLKTHYETNCSGDVKHIWDKPKRASKFVKLAMEMDGPISTKMVLRFNQLGHVKLIEKILVSQSFYIQSGVKGDVISTTFQNPKVIFELPSSGFRKYWDPLALKVLTKGYRKEGLTRKAAKQLAIHDIETVRDLHSLNKYNIGQL